jgi:hypothetical protein
LFVQDPQVREAAAQADDDREVRNSARPAAAVIASRP